MWNTYYFEAGLKCTADHMETRKSGNCSFRCCVAIEAPVSTAESFEVGVNADCTHTHRRQKPDVSG